MANMKYNRLGPQQKTKRKLNREGAKKIVVGKKAGRMSAM